MFLKYVSALFCSITLSILFVQKWCSHSPNLATSIKFGGFALYSQMVFCKFFSLPLIFGGKRFLPGTPRKFSYKE